MIEYAHGIMDADGETMFCAHTFSTIREAARTSPDCWPPGHHVISARFVSAWVTLTDTEHEPDNAFFWKPRTAQP